MGLDDVKQIILVLSGKGGVGKSTISTQLAIALLKRNFKVGLLDIDLCGPSIPYLLQIENKEIYKDDKGWKPVETAQGLRVMSIAFLSPDRNRSIVWRGPKKTSTINQFISDVSWDTLDYLVIDTPPGTSDEHITVMDRLKHVKCERGAVIITTPQQLAIDDVQKEINFCEKTGIPIIGVIENMSGYVCPHCDECTNIFGSGGGEALAIKCKIDFLGRLPIDSRVTGVLADGFGDKIVDSIIEKSLNTIIDQIIKKIEHVE